MLYDMKSYEQFWEELVPAYPVTKWEIKIPIAIELETFDVDFDVVVKNLDDVMQQLFDKTDEARELADKWYQKWFANLYSWEFTGIVRFDCMFDADGNLKLVEANTNWPDGLLMHDVTYWVLSDAVSRKHLDLFLQFFDKNEYIFILYEKEGFIDPHFLEYEKLVENWYKVWIWTFEDLEFADGNTFYQGNKIDSVRLSMNSGRFSEHEYSLLKSANLRFVNSFDMAWLADKSLLKWIDNTMLMKTFVLNNETKDIVIKNKDKYVIKPTNLNEGIGVVIWVDTLQEDWNVLIEKNLNNLYLAQEYISLLPKKTSLYIDGWIIEGDFYYDFCPHLFYKNGKLIWTGQVLVRYSKNKIVNVLRGGGIGYWKMG